MPRDKRKRGLITPEVLAEILHYDPKTGRLHWKRRAAKWFHGCPNCTAKWNGINAGKEAFKYTMANGYKSGAVFTVTLLAHRIAYAIYHGVDPGKWDVDHINGCRADNRIENLRLVDCTENMRNMAMHRTNKSGVTGVFRPTKGRKWVATIGSHRIGSFEELEDAVAARKRAEVEHGYHPNHGRRVN